MAKVIDKRVCQVCKKEYKWEYILAQNLSCCETLDCEVITQGMTHPRCLSSHSEKPNFRFSIRCPYCDNLESFDYTIPDLHK